MSINLKINNFINVITVDHSVRVAKSTVFQLEPNERKTVYIKPTQWNCQVLGWFLRMHTPE